MTVGLTTQSHLAFPRNMHHLLSWGYRILTSRNRCRISWCSMEDPRCGYGLRIRRATVQLWGLKVTPAPKTDELSLSKHPGDLFNTSSSWFPFPAQVLLYTNSEPGPVFGGQVYLSRIDPSTQNRERPD